jgi:hypothetical protein
MAKTTIRVRDLVEKVNQMISMSVCAPFGREALTVLLSSVLHETGNYVGFRYLDARSVPQGCLPGIATEIRADGSPETVFPDPSRVEYFLSTRLASQKKMGE